DAFVSNVSHELRTPLTSMKLYAHLISLQPEKQEDYMKRLVREVERQEYIIEDLLRLSQLTHEKTSLTLAVINLNELTADFVTDRIPLAQTRKLTLTFCGQPDLPPVLADAGLLGQVLSILLTNALNYTPAGEIVTVFTVSKEDDAWVGFCVSDTGAGISTEDQACLFERFYRGAVGRDSAKPGTGLGLAIAKEIVTRHQGQIEVKSGGVAGEGSIFTVWLPQIDAL
ncbi:MAG: HAMP domain-containing histidine kinase, partial [Chloroflexi bacterium]|nr:HAMP domain-containing histidine kinase [Chloroflexota bacterium]